MRRASVEDHGRMQQLHSVSQAMGTTAGMSSQFAVPTLGMGSSDFQLGYFQPPNEHPAVYGPTIDMMQPTADAMVSQQQQQQQQQQHPNESGPVPGQWRFYPISLPPVMENIPSSGSSANLSNWRPIHEERRHSSSTELIYFEGQQQQHTNVAHPTPDASYAINDPHQRFFDAYSRPPPMNLADTSDPVSRAMSKQRMVESAPASPHHTRDGKYASSQPKGFDHRSASAVSHGPSDSKLHSTLEILFPLK